MSVSTPTVLTSGGAQGSAASDTSASFTPTSGALLIAWSSNNKSGSTPTDTTISDSFGADVGTWTRVEATVAGTGVRAAAFYALVEGGSPSSADVTFNYSPNAVRRSWAVLEVTGQDTTPVVENPTNSSTATTLSVTISSIGTGALVMSGLNAAAASAVTPGTGNTESIEVSSNGSNQARTQVQYTTTDTTPDWSGLSSSTGNAGIALEIAQVVAAAVLNKYQMMI